LVVIDNIILDVKEFADAHPGGKFVIKQSIGRDISKFFFGGYSLDGNLNGSTVRHNHSSFARMIVNELAIATLHREITTATQIVKVNEELTYMVNSTT